MFVLPAVSVDRIYIYITGCACAVHNKSPQTPRHATMDSYDGLTVATVVVSFVSVVFPPDIVGSVYAKTPSQKRVVAAHQLVAFAICTWFGLFVALESMISATRDEARDNADFCLKVSFYLTIVASVLSSTVFATPLCTAAVAVYATHLCGSTIPGSLPSMGRGGAWWFYMVIMLAVAALVLLASSKIVAVVKKLSMRCLVVLAFTLAFTCLCQRGVVASSVQAHGHSLISEIYGPTFVGVCLFHALCITVLWRESRRIARRNRAIEKNGARVIALL